MACQPFYLAIAPQSIQGRTFLVSKRAALYISRAVNQLYYGDNLQVLREHIADESVDLIYLDSPFNSKRV